MSESLKDTDTFQTVPEAEPTPLTEAQVLDAGLPSALAGGLASLASGLKLGQLTVTIQNYTHPPVAEPEE